ncbi:MAG: aminotransferase class IV [Deltaproteobacteria bacterium]|nr:aminotransferase class IV [Deltaproteobacteria bacterium]
MRGLVYINGELIPGEEAKVSVFDHGFLYGDGLFETMRAYQRRIFRLEHHLQRLFLSLEYLKFLIPFNFDSLKEAIYKTIEANRLEDAYIRLTVTRGEGATVPDPATCKAPNLIIITREYVPYSSALYQKGYKGKIVGVKPSPHMPTISMKTLNFLNHIIAKMEAKASGFNEGIMVNTDGFVTEGTVSNIFMIKEGSLFTPAKEVGLLPGVTRQAVLEIAEAKGLKTREAKITVNELLMAEEAFLTNALIEILPLVGVDERPLGKGIPGPLTQELMSAYKELVKGELKL